MFRNFLARVINLFGHKVKITVFADKSKFVVLGVDEQTKTVFCLKMKTIYIADTITREIFTRESFEENFACYICTPKGLSTTVFLKHPERDNYHAFETFVEAKAHITTVMINRVALAKVALKNAESNLEVVWQITEPT